MWGLSFSMAPTCVRNKTLKSIRPFSNFTFLFLSYNLCFVCFVHIDSGTPKAHMRPKYQWPYGFLATTISMTKLPL